MPKAIVNEQDVAMDLNTLKEYLVVKNSDCNIVLKNKSNNKKILNFYYSDNEIWYNGKLYKYDKNLRNRQSKLMENDHDLFSPMPGKIIKLNVTKGEKVLVGQTLLILEAMKMEHAIKSGIEAIVEEIFFKEGDLVDSEVELIKLGKID